MLDRIIEDLKTAPARLNTRTAHLRDRARARVAWARGEGRERLWSLQVSALERAEGLLHAAPDLPVMGKMADAAERLVHRGLEASSASPIADYDTLGAKKIALAIRELSRQDLLRVQRVETAGKARKTVLQALAKEIVRRDTRAD